MKKLRFGLVGYGAWGSHHARAIASCADAELVAIAARSEATCERARSDHPSTHVYADYRQLLSGEELDVVAVVLPTDLHHEVGMAVLTSGRHLLLEKPMASRLDYCDDLIEQARARGLVLAIGHEMRLSSLWGRVQELVHAGDIGQPLYALIELWRKPYRLGSEGWRYDLARVGNWILEEPIHFFDLARWYLNCWGEPVSVFARATAKRADRPELQDNFSTLLHFPGGAYAVISQTLAGWEHHQVVKLTGTDGALWAAWSGAMDRTLHPTFSLKRLRGEQVEEIPISRPAGEVFELDDQVSRMVRAVRGEAPPAATGMDGRWAVAMCLAAQQSVASGKVVSL